MLSLSPAFHSHPPHLLWNDEVVQPEGLNLLSLCGESGPISSPVWQKSDKMAGSGKNLCGEEIHTAAHHIRDQLCSKLRLVCFLLPMDWKLSTQLVCVIIAYYSQKLFLFSSISSSCLCHPPFMSHPSRKRHLRVGTTIYFIFVQLPWAQMRCLNTNSLYISVITGGSSRRCPTPSIYILMHPEQSFRAGKRHLITSSSPFL